MSLWPAQAPYGDADYADAFTASTPHALSGSPVAWARQVLEGASPGMRLFLRAGWRCLGFRLVRDNAVLGWPVVESADGWVVLRQQSWLFGVALLMWRVDGELTWATRVKYASPLSRHVWAIVRPIHRRFAPRALRRAVADPRVWPSDPARAWSGGQTGH